MKAIEKSGKTVEEAVELALKDLGVTRKDVEVEVIEEPSKGIFGILGVKPARVRVLLREGPLQKAEKFLKSVFEAMNIQVEMSLQENEREVVINLRGPEMGVLIGRRGETMEALQYLVNLSANKNQEVRKKIIIDIEGYRSRREETLQKLALKLADKAKQRGRNVVLEPMNSQERRIIHTALQGRDDIYTFSEGEEPYRKIVISPKK
ncbi:MAG: protein jag [Pelotomaculum sp.]|uniref:RNA-binding protein KhpB n=1 Tax=Pelotomaculum thermopropionicum (strain DSM 13744 / JCM 10971 / SI) TaxID=370438 RepID=A5CY47_PELTS|nr:protein jag [Pelotomaculum sp.]BAF61099.1 predicted RNA binding protein [Pelotomaculum thermopropionicum SI]